VVLLALSCLSLSFSTVAVAQPSRFSFTGSLNVPRTYHTATRLADGRVLVVGGLNGNDVLTSTEIYDPVRGSFRLSGRLATAREGYTATLLLSTGKVLIVGGWNRATLQYLATAELYDPATGTFTTTGSLNIARGYHEAAPLNNGLVLITGGNDNTFHLQRTAELFDPATGRFTRTGNLITARANHTATVLQNGTVLIAGGKDDTFATLASAELYDPSAGSFTATGSLVTGSSFHTATRMNDRTVLVAGGYGSQPLARAEIYDPTAGTFAATGSLGAARYGSTENLLNDGTVLVTGGSGDATAPGTAEVYDPVAGTFSLAGSLGVARSSGHTATGLADGTVLLAAGSNSSVTTPSAELYQGAMPPPPVSLQITPSNVTMLVGDIRQFTAVDNLGRPRSDVMWTVSDPTLATITSDSSPYLTAVAAGQVTLVANSQGVSAQTQVTILAQAVFPAGAVLWSAPSVSGMTRQTIPAVPSADGPDLYAVSRDSSQTLIQALMLDGRQLWQTWLPIVNANSVPDPFGGLIVTEFNTCDQTNPMKIVNLDGPTGQWRWEAVGDSTCTSDAPQLAIRDDGVIVVATSGNTSGFPELMRIQGRTGQLLSAPTIPQSSYVQQDGRIVMGYSPIGPPMVDPNGVTYVEYEVRNVAFPPRVTSAVLWLLKIAPEGSTTTTQLSSTDTDTNLFPGRIIPDGQGGVVATWTFTPSHPPADPNSLRAANVTSGGGVTTYNLPIQPAQVLFDPTGLPVNPALALSENGAAFAAYGPDLFSFAPGSGALRWRYSGAPDMVSILVSDSTDGLVAKTTAATGTDTVMRFDSSGGVTQITSGRAVEHLIGNIWAGATAADINVFWHVPLELSSLWFSWNQKRTNQAVQRHTIVVKCRLVDDTRAYFFGALHCYIVTKDRTGAIELTQGGEENGQPSGVLRMLTRPGETIAPNKPADSVSYAADDSGAADSVDCLKNTALRMDAARVRYYFLRPNSNGALVELMRACGRSVSLPFRAVGKNVPLDPWQ
jgi:hypothetical protein